MILASYFHLLLNSLLTFLSTAFYAGSSPGPGLSRTDGDYRGQWHNVGLAWNATVASCEHQISSDDERKFSYAQASFINFANLIEDQLKHVSERMPQAIRSADCSRFILENNTATRLSDMIIMIVTNIISSLEKGFVAAERRKEIVHTSTQHTAMFVGQVREMTLAWPRGIFSWVRWLWVVAMPTHTMGTVSVSKELGQQMLQSRRCVRDLASLEAAGLALLNDLKIVRENHQSLFESSYQAVSEWEAGASSRSEADLDTSTHCPAQHLDSMMRHCAEAMRKVTSLPEHVVHHRCMGSGTSTTV